MSIGTPASILIVKTSAIGDVIQTFPVLEYLRLKFPRARIDWAVEEQIAPLLKAHPQLDNAIEIRSRAWRRAPLKWQTREEFRRFCRQLRATSYDVLFDLQGNAKSAVVTACAKAGVKVGFGWKSVREKSNLLATHKRLNFPIDLNIRQKHLALVQSYFEDAEVFEAKGVRLAINDAERERLKGICKEGRTQLMVCFGSKWSNKQLEMATLTSLLEKIAGDCDPFYLFIFGDEEERRCAEMLSSHFQERSAPVGNLSLPLWQALMWEMDGVIAVDSAALHLCGTTQTPSFSVFGPSLASYYKPSEERHLFVQGSCPYGRVFTSRCPVLRTCPTGACMRQLSAEELFAAYQKRSQM